MAENVQRQNPPPNPEEPEQQQQQQQHPKLQEPGAGEQQQQQLPRPYYPELYLVRNLTERRVFLLLLQRLLQQNRTLQQLLPQQDSFLQQLQQQELQLQQVEQRQLQQQHQPLPQEYMQQVRQLMRQRLQKHQLQQLDEDNDVEFNRLLQTCRTYIQNLGASHSRRYKAPNAPKKTKMPSRQRPRSRPQACRSIEFPIPSPDAVTLQASTSTPEPPTAQPATSSTTTEPWTTPEFL